jgi:hypothetical protein
MTTLCDIDELDGRGTILWLTTGERRALARLTDRVGAEWQADGSVRVFSRRKVGTAALSPDTMIKIRTKVPMENVLLLASLAYRTLRIPKAVGYTLLRSTDEVLDWLAVLLVTQIEALLAYGQR